MRERGRIPVPSADSVVHRASSVVVFSCCGAGLHRMCVTGEEAPLPRPSELSPSPPSGLSTLARGNAGVLCFARRPSHLVGRSPVTCQATGMWCSRSSLSLTVGRRFRSEFLLLPLSLSRAAHWIGSSITSFGVHGVGCILKHGGLFFGGVHAGCRWAFCFVFGKQAFRLLLHDGNGTFLPT